VVSVKKVEQGYCFNLEDGSRAWSERLSNEAAIALAAIPTYGIETSHESILVELLELRRMGLIELTDEGEMELPLTVSEIGRQVDKVLWDLQLQPVGTVKSFDCAPVESLSNKYWHLHQRKTKLIGIALGASLIILAVAILNLGYQILTGIASFLALVIQGGGEPAKAALELMADPSGLLGQLAVLVVFSMVIPLLVGAMKVRHALNSPTE
jgi:hypothetical protein